MENGYYNYYIGEKGGIIGKGINAFQKLSFSLM